MKKIYGSYVNSNVEDKVQGITKALEDIENIISVVDSRAKEFLSVNIYEDRNKVLPSYVRTGLENNILLISKINKALEILKGVDEKYWLILAQYAHSGNPFFGIHLKRVKRAKTKRNILLRFLHYIKNKI